MQEFIKVFCRIFGKVILKLYSVKNDLLIIFLILMILKLSYATLITNL